MSKSIDQSILEGWMGTASEQVEKLIDQRDRYRKALVNIVDAGGSSGAERASIAREALENA